MGYHSGLRFVGPNQLASNLPAAQCAENKKITKHTSHQKKKNEGKQNKTKQMKQKKCIHWRKEENIGVGRHAIKTNGVLGQS